MNAVDEYVIALTENKSDSNDTFTIHHNRTIFTETAEEPKWIVIFFLILLSCGGIINFIHALALLRSKRNGVLSLILQLSLVDTFACFDGATEILTLYKNSWYFPPEVCPLFKGTEILINTSTIYLLICFNFHVISVWNLQELQLKKNNRNPLTACTTNKDDSSECLVTKQENANRVVTIDYRKRKDEISIIFPTILIWIVSLSLSVPNFTLSSTLKLKSNYTLCAVIDVHYGQILQYSLLIFKILLPLLLLSLTLILLTIKLSQNSSDIENILTKKMLEIRKLLIFGVVLSVFYLLTSFQRQCLHFVHTIFYSFNKNAVSNFKMPPLYNVFLSQSVMTYLAMLHYSASTIRGLLYLTILPKFPHLIRTKIFICCKIKQ